MVVLDTHALLWWALDPDRLSPAAAACLRDMDRDGGFASAISIWELGIKIQRGKLDLGIPLEEFTRRVENSAIVELLPVTTATWLRSLELTWHHRDPADRRAYRSALFVES